jgi:hypothetical protein
MTRFGLDGGARWIRTAGPGCSIGTGDFLPIFISPLAADRRGLSVPEKDWLLFATRAMCMPARKRSGQA